MSPSPHRPSRRLARACIASLVFVAGACSRDAAAPDVGNASVVLPPAVARLAVSLDVPTASSTPALSGRAGDHAAEPLIASSRRAHGQTPARLTPSAYASLLGVDGVSVEIGRVDRSVLGRFTPGKVRVMVVLRVRNALDRTTLLTPTFPAPPAGDGLYLFAVQSVAVETPGGVTVGGNTVSVEAPSHGTVVPGPEWEGALYDYFRGPATVCRAGISTCARWTRFAAPVAAGGVSGWRTVSYDIDPTVRHMRLRFIVAADLANAF